MNKAKEIKDILLWRGDGDVTLYVVVARATEIAAKGFVRAHSGRVDVTDGDVADVLTDVLGDAYRINSEEVLLCSSEY